MVNISKTFALLLRVANLKTEHPNIFALKLGQTFLLNNLIMLVHNLMLSKCPPLGSHCCWRTDAYFISVFNPALVSIKINT